MKIYITGIAGMLGYGICKTLQTKCDISGIDILDVDISNIQYSVGSILDYDFLEKDIKAVRPDCVIHTAAMVNVDLCEEHREQTFQLNADVTKKISQICNDQKIKMIYISTDAVFDGEQESLYVETDGVNPVNYYGETKLMGETAVLQYPDNLVLRTNIYGMNIQNKQSFGEWIYYALQKDETLNMFTDIDFSPILVNELAEVIYKALERNLSGLYHVCGTGKISKYDFGCYLKEVFGIKTGTILATTSERSNLKAKRAKHMGMSNEKICTELGIKISTPKESIRKFYTMMQEEGQSR